MRIFKKALFLDKERTVFSTVTNLYKEVRIAFTTVDALHREKGLTSDVKKAYQEISKDLYDLLVFGQIQAIGPLKQLYEKGLGVEKDEYKLKLFTAIGAQLGHEGCQKSMIDKDYSDVHEEAKTWMQIIKKVEEKNYAPTDRLSKKMLKEIYKIIINTTLPALPGRVFEVSIDKKDIQESSAKDFQSAATIIREQLLSKNKISSTQTTPIFKKNLDKRSTKGGCTIS